MRIILGADHGGYELKEIIKKTLQGWDDFEVVDMGANRIEAEDDYVEYAKKVAREVLEDKSSKGILICRNGMGMSIVANRYVGVRCGLGFDAQAVAKGRTDDDINILSLPADYLNASQVDEIVKAFLDTKFSGGEKYSRRLMAIDSK